MFIINNHIYIMFICFDFLNILQGILKLTRRLSASSAATNETWSRELRIVEGAGLVRAPPVENLEEPKYMVILV